MTVINKLRYNLISLQFVLKVVNVLHRLTSLTVISVLSQSTVDSEHPFNE